MSLIVAMFSGFIMNSVLPRKAVVRHIYTICVAVYLQFFMFRWAMYHVYIMAYVAYVILMVLPRDQSHKVCMVWSFGYTSLQMMYAMYTDFGGFKMDITTYTMMLATKLWGLGWAMRDGFNHPQNLSKE